MGFHVSQPSFQSLFVEVLALGQPISTATAFVGKADVGRALLLTNRHVVTGRHQDTGQMLSSTGAIPDELRIWPNARTELGQFVPVHMPLLTDGQPNWFEHPTLGEHADLVALQLPDRADIAIYPYRVLALTHMSIEPAQVLSVVGFPFGEKTGPSFAVWATGFVASEPEIDHGGRPVFLIDCRSRPGQSGSPVILHQGFRKTREHAAEDEPSSELLGIYSGRINSESDLGVVWKSHAIEELLVAASFAASWSAP